LDTIGAVDDMMPRNTTIAISNMETYLDLVSIDMSVWSACSQMMIEADLACDPYVQHLGLVCTHSTQHARPH
jgi:hypothetical protein